MRFRSDLDHRLVDVELICRLLHSGTLNHIDCQYLSRVFHFWPPRTIGVPDLSDELHLGRIQRVVLWKFELGGEYAAFEWCTLRALYQSLPDE